MSALDLSILVLGYNQRETVLALMNCIQRQRFAKPLSFEVVYTDDGSTDGTIDTLGKENSYYFTVRIADNNPQHSSRAQARNRAARVAEGEWLLFLDGDGEIDDTFIEALWQHKQMGTIRLAAIHVHKNAFCPARRYEVLRSPAYRFGDRPVAAWMLQGGCFLIERSLFWKYGGFDETLKGRSGEDVDLGARFAADHIELRAVPSAHFYHNHPRSIEQLIDVKRKYAAQGLSRMVERSPELFNAARLHWVFDPKPPHRSTGVRIIVKMLLSIIPVRILASIAERNGNFRWCGLTIIPLLAFTGTVLGYNDYLKSNCVTEEDA